jgi:hypothetical protein
MESSEYLLPPEEQQQQFSQAYIAAIASAAGYAAYRSGPDFDAIDIEIKQSSMASTRPKRHVLYVQAKCTFAHVPSAGSLKYPLDTRTYDIMRNTETLDPHILVVVHVPSNPFDWIKHDSSFMLMHHQAYWYSLRGMAETQNKSSITIGIPTSQCFTVDWLRTAMNKIARVGLL